MELCTPSFDHSSIHYKRNGQTNRPALRDESLKLNLSFALLRCGTANLISAYTQKLPTAGRYCPASCSLPSTCSLLQEEWGYPTFWQHKEPQSKISPLSFLSLGLHWTLTWRRFTKYQLGASCSFAFMLIPEGVYPTNKFIFSVM